MSEVRGDPRHDFEILDVVSFLARQIEESEARSMTKISDVLKRRAVEQSRIRKQLNSMRAEEEALLREG